MENTRVRQIIRNLLTEQAEPQSLQQNLQALITTLKNTANEIENNWNSKEREAYILDKIQELTFTRNGDSLKKNKQLISALKKVYNSANPNNFTTENLSKFIPETELDAIYVIGEPFGSKASPDFLFITSRGILGVEDKSSKGGKVSFNTGTPGGNKFIMYYDRKDKKIYLISGKQWGWEGDIEREYKEFTKEMINYAKNKFEEKFGNRLKNMTYYARPMLVDKNKIKDIWNKDEQDISDMLSRYV